MSNPEMKKAIKKLNSEDMSAKDISNRLGVSLSTVYAYLKEIREESQRKNPEKVGGRIPPKPNDKLTGKDLSKLLGATGFKISENLAEEFLREAKEYEEVYNEYMGNYDIHSNEITAHEKRATSIQAFRVIVTDSKGEESEIFSTWNTGSPFPGRGLFADIENLSNDEDFGDIRVEAMFNRKWVKLW